MIISHFSTTLILINAAAVTTAAIVDLFSRKIPNFCSAIIALCAIGTLIISGQPQIEMHVLSGVYAGMVGAILFQRKILGGGDVKLIAALSIWFLPQQLGLFVLWVVICGGVLGFAYTSLVVLKLLGERFLPRLALPAIRADAGMPYGVATAFGFALAAWRIL